MKEIVRFEKVSKAYGEQGHEAYALQEASFTIYEGEFVIILGPSGAGKSTLLNLLGGMDRVSAGHIYIDKQDIVPLSEVKLAAYRAENIGFVFQFYNLIPTLTVYENVALMKELKKQIISPKTALEMVGLQAHGRKFPAQLSGGEQQRVAIARAICKNPTLMLCDEPTGALDSDTGISVLNQLQDMCRKQGHTTIIVTHNAALAKAADKVIMVRNGRIEDVMVQENPCSIREVEW